MSNANLSCDDDVIGAIRLAIDTRDADRVAEIMKTFSSSPQWPEGYDLLMYALNNETYDIVRILLNNGARVNATKEHESTPLHLAVQSGIVDIVKKVLENGAGVNAQDAQGQTPLHLALSDTRLNREQKSIIEALLKHGADVNATDISGKIPYNAASPFGVVLGFFSSCRGLEFPTMFSTDWYLQGGEDDIGEIMFYAVTHKDTDRVERIINTYGLSHSPNWLEGYTLLQCAFQRENYDIVRILLFHDAKVNSPEETQSSPLHFAVHSRREDIVKGLLKKNANVNARNDYGKTPLHVALEDNRVTSEQKKIIEDLLEHGADVTALDDTGRTPLQQASIEGIVSGFFSHCRGLEFAKMDYAGYLHKGEVHAAMVSAVYHGYTEGVDEIIHDYGLSYSPEWKEGYALVECAIKNKNYNIARLLLHSGAEVNSTEEETSTLLHLAVEAGVENVVKILLKGGANVNAQDELLKTPLHLALRDDRLLSGQTEIIEVLLESGADVNATDEEGDMPLHEAASMNIPSVVRMLVEQGADVWKLNKSLFTPLMVARACGHADVVRVLVEILSWMKTKPDWKNVFLTHSLENVQIPFTGFIKYAVGDIVIECNKENLKKCFADIGVDSVGTVACLEGSEELVPLGGSEELTSLEGSEELTSLEGSEGFISLEGDDEFKPIISTHLLFRAAAAGNVNVCEKLLTQGANVDARRYGETALQIAGKNNHFQIVEMLNMHGADFDCKDEDGNTPLQRACLNGYLETVNVLLPGSDVNIVNKCKETIFDLAQKQPLENGKELLDLLSRHVFKMVAAGLYVSAEVLESFFHDPEELWRECEREIARLKKNKILTFFTSFTDIMEMTSDKATAIAGNENIGKFFKSEYFQKKFPIYGKMIFAKYLAEEKLHQLRMKVNTTRSENDLFSLPYLCLKKISGYLSKDDLISFRAAREIYQ